MNAEMTLDDRQQKERHSLWELIEDIRFAMLTTRHADGSMHARPMTTQNRAPQDGETRVWFFASLASELAGDIRREPQVNVTYSSPDKDRYVSVSGQAVFVDDSSRKQALWSTAAQAWFPNGVDDPDLGLLEVRIDRGEYWDVKSSKVTQLFKMAKAALTGERPEGMAEHARIQAL